MYELPSGDCPEKFADGLDGLKELVPSKRGGEYTWKPPANAKAGQQVGCTGAGARPAARQCQEIPTSALIEAAQ